MSSSGGIFPNTDGDSEVSRLREGALDFGGGSLLIDCRKSLLFDPWVVRAENG